MIPFDERRAYIMQEESTRNFPHLSHIYTYNTEHERAVARRGRSGIKFHNFPGAGVRSAGVMQLFRCYNLKSWSIRPRHGRNQQRAGVTGG